MGTKLGSSLIPNKPLGPGPGGYQTSLANKKKAP